MKNLSNFFPGKVYFCDCLKTVIGNYDKPCSLQDLCNEINQGTNIDREIIYCVKCNDRKDVAFCCTNHVTLGSYLIQFDENTPIKMEIEGAHFCFSCIKRCLKEQYYKLNCKKVNI